MLIQVEFIITAIGATACVLVIKSGTLAAILTAITSTGNGDTFPVSRRIILTTPLAVAKFFFIPTGKIRIVHRHIRSLTGTYAVTSFAGTTCICEQK